MTLVLSIAQCRALRKILHDVDDRKVTMYQDAGVLVVDPSDARGEVADDRMFFIGVNGVVSNEWVQPIATPDLEVVIPEETEPEPKEKKEKKKDPESVVEFKYDTWGGTEPHDHVSPEPKKLVDPDVVSPSSTEPPAK